MSGTGGALTSSGMPPGGVLAVAGMFLLTGVAHFAAPAFFDQIMPPWIPNARAATLLSGAAEIALGLGVLFPATRSAAGWGLIALLVAVFPANIYMLWQAHAANASTGSLVGLWLRLPLQPFLMWWVWRVTQLPRG